jgi:hypothetical protein
MDVNSAFLQIPSPTATSPSEGAAPRPQEVKPPSLGGMRKSFASVLRTAQQREDKGRPQQPDDTESRRAAKPDTDLNKGNGVNDETPSPGAIESRGRDAKTERLPQRQTDQSDGKDGRSQNGGTIQTDVPAELVRVLGEAVPSQGAPVTPTTQSPNDPERGASENGRLASVQDDETTGAATTPVVVPLEAGVLAAAPGTMNQALALPPGGTVLLAQQGQTASTLQPLRETSEVPSGQPLAPMPEGAGKTLDADAREQKGTPPQGQHPEEQAASVPRTTEGGKQPSPVSQELSRLDAAGPQLTRLVEQPVQQKQADATAHPHHDLHSPLPSTDAGREERAGKLMAIESHGLQAGSDSGQSSDLRWFNQDERQAGSRETPWTSHAPMVSSQSDLPGDHSDQAVAATNVASAQSRPVDSRPASPAGVAPSVSAAHEIEPFMPAMSRSVVFEIAEPDLGRINIRVAMTNELVHAHLSSDRSDVGQLLFNGQDRLQSALQSNGLDLGQFRVDIDRQSAGRSFQQGPPQDQSRMWQQASNGDPREAGFFERHAETSLSYAGRLNLVA